MSIQIGERNGTRSDYKSLFNMLQKSNNEKINMQLTIDKLTGDRTHLRKKKESN